jgi:hypothetical protein
LGRITLFVGARTTHSQGGCCAKPELTCQIPDEKGVWELTTQHGNLATTTGQIQLYFRAVLDINPFLPIFNEFFELYRQ